MRLALPTSSRGRRVLVGGALLVAVVGGAVADRTLFETTAGVQTASERYGVLQAQARAHPKRNVVPFLGSFARQRRFGKVCGPEVRLMEGALRRTTPPIRKAPARSCFGVVTEKQVKTFQRRHSIPPSGIYGPRTHRALSHAYSREQRADLVYIAKLIVLRKQRATVLIVTSHAQLVGQRMSYSQGGSRSYFPRWPAVPATGDCSSFVTWVLYQAGVGHRVAYLGIGSPVGWTGTLGRQGKLVPLHSPLAIGDLVFYGGGFPYGHVEVYIGHGRTVGHGSPGVHNHPYNYRAVAAVRRMIYRVRKAVRGRRRAR